jgi:TRAP transporter TAXI family solute receptor
VSDRLRKLRQKRLREYSLRDLLTVGLPALALLVGGFWLAAQFIEPAPPGHLYISSGGAGGSYEVYAARYREVLARNGVELREQASAGALENLRRLLDEADDTEVALVQSGTANGVNVSTLHSLGYLYYEPLWVFYRGERELDRLTQLKGRRIAVGPEGSGTRKLALQLLETSGIGADNATLLPLGGLAAAAALQERKVDAVFLVGAERSAAVWSLFFAEDVRLMSLSHAEAWTRLFPHLARLTLPQGAIDMTRNIPARDVTLVSPMATLVAHDSAHPALVQLLLAGGPGGASRAGHLPAAGRVPPPRRRRLPAGAGCRALLQVGQAAAAALPAVLGRQPDRPHGGDAGAGVRAAHPDPQVRAGPLQLAGALAHLPPLRRAEVPRGGGGDESGAAQPRGVAGQARSHRGRRAPHPDAAGLHRHAVHAAGAPRRGARHHPAAHAGKG